MEKDFLSFTKNIRKIKTSEELFEVFTWAKDWGNKFCDFAYGSIGISDSERRKENPITSAKYLWELHGSLL